MFSKQTRLSKVSVKLQALRSALVIWIFLLPFAAVPNEVRIEVGMECTNTITLIKKCGGTDITQVQEVIGPKGEWPLSGIYWSLSDYDLVIALGCTGGKIDQLSYWNGSDFNESKLHRAKSEKRISSLTLNTQTKKAVLPKQTVERLRNPISVIASTTGRFVQGRSWNLSVNSAGKAHLTIDSYPAPKSREFDITPQQIEQLADNLKKENFFKLKKEYGEFVADGSTDVLTIVMGEESHSVSIHYLMNWAHNAPSKLKEPARAVRVFQIVRGWFDDPDAVDLRRYDQIVLEAAARSR